MNKKIFNILFALVLVLSFSLVMAVPAAASDSAISNLVANPYAFNSNTGKTTITYTLSDVIDGYVLLEIYDSGNNLVRTIVGGIQSSGDYSIVWDGKDNDGNAVPEGIHTAKLSVSVGIGDIYEFVLKWGSHGTGDGQFQHPYDIAVDSNGNVYVVDTGNQRVQKFDSAGNFNSKWGSLGTGDGQFKNPWSLAVDSNGNVYVADTWNNRVQKFDSVGNFITKWGGYGSGDGQFDHPYGLAVDLNGNVYVADSWNDRVQKFDSVGNFITKWGSYGTGDGQFDGPYCLAVDSNGDVYVPDIFNNRVQKFDSAGNFITKWGSYGTGDGQFNLPHGVGVDSNGNVYIGGYQNHRVQKFDSVGNFITKWGSYGSGAGQFSFPCGVAIDLNGNVYVTDPGNNRVQKFAPPITVISAETNVLVDNNTAPVADADGPYLGAAGSLISFDGNGSYDPDGDTLIYDWDWGDGNISSDAGANPIYSYTDAGIYDVCLTVGDSDLSDEACTYVVIYDPNGGFVTGGGWIDSPAGAYSPEPTLTGKATFGFVSKYNKKTELAEGNTEFQFHVAGLNFRSSSYDWLVVTGSNYARFKGSGTINGAGDYKFMIWAGDNGPDTYRIRIWEEDQEGNETVIYDNGFDQAIGGGSIIIHEGK